MINCEGAERRQAHKIGENATSRLTELLLGLPSVSSLNNGICRRTAASEPVLLRQMRF